MKAKKKSAHPVLSAERWCNVRLSLLLLLPLVIVCSCAQHRSPAEQTEPVSRYTGVSPMLLLNPTQGPKVDPQLFAFRSPWPSTPGPIDLGQTIYYREFWYDRQWIRPNAPDSSYKLSEGYRSGFRYRN